MLIYMYIVVCFAYYFVIIPNIINFACIFPKKYILTKLFFFSNMLIDVTRYMYMLLVFNFTDIHMVIII